MTSEIRTNTLTSRAGLSTVTLTDSGPMFSGITTFVDNSTFSVGTGGTIHAPATNTLNIGVNNTESLRIDSNSNLKVAGIVTATHFYGNGSNLSGISAGTSLSGSTNNTVCTVTGANAIQGESNLQFDGTTLTVSGYIESVGTSGRGAKLGNLSVGFAGLYNTIQNLTDGHNLHLQYNVDGDLYTNEGGGDMITADIRPKTNGNFSLGTNSYRWANIHTNDLNLSNEGSANDVDGTWGNYTIQEGESDLFLINNRSGKKYRFNLTEVS